MHFLDLPRIGALACYRIRAAAMLACAICLPGCGSSSTSSDPLFKAKAGLEIGGKLEIPDDPQFSSSREAIDGETQVIVLCFFSTECDATSKVSGRIKSLHRKSKSAKFIGLVTSQEANLAQFLDTHDFDFEVIGDFDHAMAELVGANRTPAFFVFDPQRVLVYKGPIDDSTLVAKDARQNLLASAISAAAKGKTAPDSMPFVGRPILGEH